MIIAHREVSNNLKKKKKRETLSTVIKDDTDFEFSSRKININRAKHLNSSIQA